MHFKRKQLLTLLEEVFSSFKVLNQSECRTFYTEKRLELVKALRHNGFDSMREVAEYVDRDSSDVRKDLRRLQEIGVVRIEEGEKYGQKSLVPVLRYEVFIGLPVIAGVRD